MKRFDRFETFMLGFTVGASVEMALFLLFYSVGR